jgi:hypothetical protein
MVWIEERVTSEKRKYPRFNIDLPVKYSRRSNLFSKYGRAVNPSEGGLLVHLPEEMVIGQRLALKVFLYPHSDLNIISTSVKVVWTGIHMRKDFTWDYPTGVSFVDMPPKDMMKFKNFLVSFIQNKTSTSYPMS